jgi:DNA-directed RNA polymerase subunit alpha
MKKNGHTTRKPRKSQLSEAIITKVFDKWWPDLESNISKIMASNIEPAQAERSESDILKEILELSRYIARNTKDDDAEMEKLRQLLHLPIRELEFGEITRRELEQAQLTTVLALCGHTPTELTTSGVSKKAIKESQEKLTALGLTFGMSFDERLLAPPKKYKRV